MNHAWVGSMTGGAENYRRTIEFADFEEQGDVTPSDWLEFCDQQNRDWIKGDREAEPVPENYADVDPRMKSPELFERYKQIEIEKFLSQGGYSVFDVLNGTAMVDALNHIDPKNDDVRWELATD